jgi:hypothetical protein
VKAVTANVHKKAMKLFLFVYLLLSLVQLVLYVISIIQTVTAFKIVMLALLLSISLYSGPKPKPATTCFKTEFFGMINGTAIHCDNDFRPLVPIRIAKSVVTTLARRDGFSEICTPLCAALGSHESKSIQIADILVGMIRTKLSNSDSVDPLKPLFFDARKMKKYKDTLPKAYYWFPS